MCDNNFKKLPPFKWFILENFPFIEADFDALTNYELYCKLCEYVNLVNKNVNSIGLESETLVNSFNALKDYVDNYFNNLDVQDEIDNKLDEMVLSGELTEIIQNALFNTPVNINFISRIFRTYGESEFYNVVGMTSYSNNVVILTTNDLATSFKVLTYNRANDTLSSFSLNLSGLTDICYYNNKLYYATNSTTIYESAIDGTNLDNSTITDAIKKFDIYNDMFYCLSSSSEFIILDNTFTIDTDTDITVANATGIAVTKDYVAIMVGNTVKYYKISTSNEWEYNNTNYIPTKANTCFVVGQCLAITSFGNNDILYGTTKKVIPNRDARVIAVFEGNAQNSVNSTSLDNLSYNSTRYEAQIHVASNSSYNPTGTQSKPFPHLYEALEVFENGEYTKGNIWCDEEMSFSDLIITDINKKLGLYFEGSTINGIEFRNSTYIEINNATIGGHFEDTSFAVGCIGLNLVIAGCTIDTDATYDIVATYGGRAVILATSTVNNTIATQYGGTIINRNSSDYDSKKLLDATGKFEPNSVLLYYDENATAQQGDDITINHLTTIFSALRFEIIVHEHSYWVECPISGNTKNLPVVDFTNQIFSLVNYRISIDNTNHKISIISCKLLDTSTSEQETPSTSVTYLKAVWGLT